MLVPASAGVILAAGAVLGLGAACPRIRGGDPFTAIAFSEYENLSPHPRG